MPPPAECLIDARRLVAPREHLGVLSEPSAAATRAGLARDLAGELARVVVLDGTLGELRERLRARLGLGGPVIVTGHQAEFFHAGVFAKTIAADAWAEQTGGRAVFLTVDSDIPKAPHVVVPGLREGRLQRVRVRLPECDPRLPAEWQPKATLQAWRGFFARLGGQAGDTGESLLEAFSAGWFAAAGERLDFCDALVRGHAAVERALGLGGSCDLRSSRLCATPEFRSLLAHLALHARRFAECYNSAQRAYRRRYRVRSGRRPAPPLEIGARRIELPLWIGRAGEPRQRLLVAGQAGGVEFLAGRRPVGSLPLSRLRRIAGQQEPWPLERAGWQFRPRALWLSAFARLLLGDLFIHGIGGAKYDRMTEEFVRRFFGAAPAPLCCVSATVRLPVAYRPVAPEQLRAARRRSRDLRYNPQRYLPQAPPELLRRRCELIRRSGELRARRPGDRGERRRVFVEIRRANAELLRRGAGRAAQFDRQLRELEGAWEQQRVACDREYFFALHRRSDLVQLVRKVRAAQGSAPGGG